MTPPHWARQPRGAHPFASLHEMCTRWADRLELEYATDGRGPDPVSRARESPAGNVLAATREPRLVIDPKPFIGDPAYDPVQHMLDCDERLARGPVRSRSTRRVRAHSLAQDATAYIMQLSIVGGLRTAELLDRHGYQARVVDFSFFEFTELSREKSEQIERVEADSDAYHLTFGESELMIAYLLEIKRKG
jgi:hypothetical protein